MSVQLEQLTALSGVLFFRLDCASCQTMVGLNSFLIGLCTMLVRMAKQINKRRLSMLILTVWMVGATGWGITKLAARYDTFFSHYNEALYRKTIEEAFGKPYNVWYREQVEFCSGESDKGLFGSAKDRCMGRAWPAFVQPRGLEAIKAFGMKRLAFVSDQADNIANFVLVLCGVPIAAWFLGFRTMPVLMRWLSREQMRAETDDRGNQVERLKDEIAELRGMLDRLLLSIEGASRDPLSQVVQDLEAMEKDLLGSGQTEKDVPVEHEQVESTSAVVAVQKPAYRPPDRAPKPNAAARFDDPTYRSEQKLVPRNSRFARLLNSGVRNAAKT